MKSTLLTLLLAAGFAAAAQAGAGGLSIIPIPDHVQRISGRFALSAGTAICVDSASRQTGEYLARRLRRSTGFPFAIRTVSGQRSVPGSILLTTSAADPALGAEGYDLSVTRRGVVIRAPQQAGLFYGVQTLCQLLPPQAFSPRVVPGVKWSMPCIRIQDQPRFKWRGLMLDVSRHFYTTHQVEQVLDLMAMLKLNRFHWHLTDDQGWRIQIKQYPRLTEVGAWRDSIGFGLDPKSSTAYGPDGRYGGFYTAQDIRQVVAYAAARHITVIPEIEMPGHSMAALAAYPQFGCGQGFAPAEHRGVFHGVYNPSNPQTFKFLETVLSDVFKLFPSKYVHIGGDEVPKGPWKNSPACQALMKREGLKNEKEIQSWFIRRIEKFVNAHGHTLIGWSEILQGGLAPNAVVMDWRGGGRQAALAGHDVIMTPTTYCYLDHYQSLDHSIEPEAIGGYLPLWKVYSFHPIPQGLDARARARILGMQGNVWTEYIPSMKHLEYMLFPRLDAVAEVAWSPAAARNWTNFLARVKVENRRLSALGVTYRPDHSVLVGHWRPACMSTTTTNLRWQLDRGYSSSGQYHVCLDYTHGHNGLHISSVALLENGKQIASDRHTGFAGSRPQNPVYILTLPKAKPGAHYALVATAYSGGGTDSFGRVTWRFVPYVLPGR